MPTPYVDDIAVKVGSGLSLSANEQEDWREWFQIVSGQVAGLFQQTQSGNITEISQITNNFGKMYRGEFIAVSTLSGSIDPLDVTFIGNFLSGDGHEYTTPFGTDTYNVGGVNLGALQWGGSNTDGTFFAIHGKFSGQITAGGADIQGPLTITGSNGSFAMGATPPTGPTTGTGIWGTGTDGWLALTAGVTQASLTSSGLTAGGGVAVADANGYAINLNTSFSALRAYKFRDAALNCVAGLYANSSFSQVTEFLIVDGSLPTKDAELDIQSVTTTGKQAAIVMQALNGVHNANLSLNTSAGVGGGATLSGDVRTLLTAPLNGVGPSTFSPAFVWDIQGTLNTTGAATLGSTLVVAGAISGSNLSNTNSGDQTLKTPLGGNGLAGTVALSSTMYVAPYYPAVPSASEANVQFPVPFTGSLKNMRFRLTGTQPATGTLVITLRIAATNTTITITIAAGATAGTYSDLTHTENVTAGQLISISCVNNALGVSGTIGAFSLEYDAA